MIVRCAWCGKDLGSKQTTGETDGMTSHGICEGCMQEVLKSAAQESRSYDTAS